jgi:hypothetical protein
MDLKLIVRGLWDRLGGWILVVCGGLALLLGWLGVSDTPLTSEQLPYVVSGGIFGLALVGVGATLLISSDLRDEWRKLDGIETAIRELGDRSATEAAVSSNGARPARPRRSTTKQLQTES